MTDEPDAGEKPEGPDDPGRNQGCLVWALVVVAAFVLFVVVSCGRAMTDDEDDEWVPTAFDAVQVCETWVSEKLKSPSSAEFSGTDSAPAGSDAWTVTGQVDSQNGFGAMIRTSWTCDVRFDATGEQWRGNVRLLE